MNHTKIHPKSEYNSHLIEIHMWRGAPHNLDANNPIQILINQGYVAGFCPNRLQPSWSAYRVAHADDDVDYDRDIHYYDDLRLDKSYRIGKRTFGKIDGIQLNVGHMTPNEVINRQFGRLAQMETFFMSNMSPQYGSLNGGVWLKLENAIRKIKDVPKKHDHMWVIVGPVFGDDPKTISRGGGKLMPIPEAYFCVSVDPHSYPYDAPSNVTIDCFLIPQTAPSSSKPQDYICELQDIESATQLDFFKGWGLEVPIDEGASIDGFKEFSARSEGDQSRLLKELNSAKS